jgi:CHRD domain
MRRCWERTELLEKNWFQIQITRRCSMKRLAIAILAMAGLLATATIAKADQLRALLTGYEETPSAVSTTGRGEFVATISPDGDAIVYRESFSGLQGKITQSHIHVGQIGIGGSVVIFLCQTASNPDPTGLAPECPQEGSVKGVITAANVIQGSQAPQQLKANDLAAVITAIRAGVTYANVHTDLSPGGEIRGQIRTVGLGPTR